MTTPPPSSSPSASPGSPTFSPNDHLRLLVELLRPVGVELGRRWLTVLYLVEEHQREALVAEMERRAAAMFGPAESPPPTAPAGPAARPRTKAQKLVPVSLPPPRPEPDEIRLVHPPVQRDGYVEQIEVTYGPAPAKPAAERRAAKRDGKARRAGA